MLPKMNGIEILYELKNEAPWRHIPVLILSISVDDEQIYQLYTQGAASYIPKPLTPEVLEALRQYWGRVWLPL